nr:MAG TPA: Putative S-adenosyl-L-methionine-dependent methyltransferase [Caudoviricetes sp.]
MIHFVYLLEYKIKKQLYYPCLQFERHCPLKAKFDYRH